ncbi:MAG TPA: FAD-dependent oxidoreductase [Actinomycetota bacterium]|nr:FAD-dependent oxidoreductase [Actinomycetota bacterium]
MPIPGPSRSFWLQDALAHDPGAPCPPLEAHVAADVCIVGGGFCGLWTALELRRREPGMRIVLVEADIVGGGASGRNGGFFSSSWWDLPAFVGFFGDDDGLRYARRLADAVAEVGAFVREESIDCWWHHEGTLAIRAGAWQSGIADDQAVELAARLGEAERLQPRPVSEARGVADSPRITSAVFAPDNATVQPARLARGLRRVLLARGVAIHERTPAVAIDGGRPAVVRTPHGAVKADHVVLAHGSWAASWPGFGRSFAVIADTMVATEPIPDLLEEIRWTSHVGLADGRELLFYLRRTDDDRIAIGGGALGIAFGGRAASRAVTHDRRAAQVAADGLTWLFPQLESVRFTHAWGGPIDQTASMFPFFRTLRSGNVHAGLGFSGHGLSQTYVGGAILASMVLGLEDEHTSLPVARPELGRVPPEPIRWPAARLAAWALESGDRRERDGRRRGIVRTTLGDAPSRVRTSLMSRHGRRPDVTRRSGASADQ